MQQYVNVPISCAIPLNTNWHIDILFNFPNKACRLSKKSGYSIKTMLFQNHRFPDKKDKISPGVI